MTRNDMANQLAKTYKDQTMTPALAVKIVNTVIDSMASALKEGQIVQLRGFATLSVAERKPRKAYNFQDNKTISIPGRKVLHITTPKDFFDNENTDV